MGFYGIENPNPTTQQFAYPRRGGAKLSGTCIVHTAEMYGALNTAAFCMRRSDYGCYHTIVDDTTIIEVYPYEYETWQDSETNNWAVGISAACKAADWHAMSGPQLEGYYRNLAWAAADFVVYMRDAYGITVPLRRLTGAEARARVPGFCAHGDSGIARSDPGIQFDWAKFFAYTKEYLDGGTISHEPEKAEKMLYLTNGGDGKVWIGDGLFRWHVPNPSYLQHYRNTKSVIEQFEDGKIQTWNPEALGLDIVAVIKSVVAEQLSQVQPTAKVALEPADIEAITANLVNTLAPNLAKDLAKRLSE